MSELRNIDVDDCKLQWQTPSDIKVDKAEQVLSKTEVEVNDTKVEFESNKAELMLLAEEIKRSNDNLSRLESKLNRIQAFGYAVIVITVLFWIQANWTSLACGAGRSIETFMFFKEFVLSMFACARKKIRIVIQECLVKLLAFLQE
jgi:hypothetical protein